MCCAACTMSVHYTVNREFFIVEILLYTTLCMKIKCMKLKRRHIIDVNVHGKGSFV